MFSNETCSNFLVHLQTNGLREHTSESKKIYNPIQFFLGVVQKWRHGLRGSQILWWHYLSFSTKMRAIHGTKILTILWRHLWPTSLYMEKGFAFWICLDKNGNVKIECRCKKWPEFVTTHDGGSFLRSLTPKTWLVMKSSIFMTI